MVTKIDNRVSYPKFEIQLNMKNIKINKDDTARAQLQHKKTKNNNNNY